MDDEDGRRANRNFRSQQEAQITQESESSASSETTLLDEINAPKRRVLQQIEQFDRGVKTAADIIIPTKEGLALSAATGGAWHAIYRAGKAYRLYKNGKVSRVRDRDVGNGSCDAEGDFGPLNQTPKARERGEIQWVDENAAMSVRARNFDDAAIGSRSNVVTQKGQAPQLMRTLPDGSQRPVRFDGVDGNVLIDRKLSVVTTNKAKDQIRRQSEALRQNGYQGRWEVPTESQAKRARKMFNELGIDNITVSVVNEPKL